MQSVGQVNASTLLLPASHSQCHAKERADVKSRVAFQLRTDHALYIYLTPHFHEGLLTTSNNFNHCAVLKLIVM